MRNDSLLPGILSVILFISFVMASCTSKVKDVIYPPGLKAGDKIAIVSPAGPIDSVIVDSAAATIRDMGYVPVIYPNALGKHGHFSGTHDERLSDLKAALADPSIKAVLCSRGGYGAALLLDSLASLKVEKTPKWIIGFSDISALHSFMASRNVASIHSSMAKQLARGKDDYNNKLFFEILKGNFPHYTFPSDFRNHLGHAEGRLLGGNLAVIQALINTPYDIIKPGTILFIEDVSEPIYKVERILYQLRMAGIFSNLKGLVIGQFTDYRADDNHETMEDMIAEALRDYPELPVVFNIPVGHVDENVPMIESAYVELDITPEKVSLVFKKQ